LSEADFKAPAVPAQASPCRLYGISAREIRLWLVVWIGAHVVDLEGQWGDLKHLLVLFFGG